MTLKILCTQYFNQKELQGIDTYAALHGMTREEVVRKAVAFFASQCVPTHSRKAKVSRM